MKILWIVNVELPEASKLTNSDAIPYGGWLINLSREISKKEEIELTIAYPKKTTRIRFIEGEKISYVKFNPINFNSKKRIENNQELTDILNIVQPNLVHIFGTELSHSLAMVNLCNKYKIKYLVSLQGLVSTIHKHIIADLPLKAIFGSTLRNIVLRDNVHGMKRKFEKRGTNEIKLIKLSENIVGRTEYDKACVEEINPRIKYYHNNEILRDEFYKQKWSLENSKKHSIFLSQGQYSLKGLHYAIEALSVIIQEFPDSHMYVAGKDITKHDTLRDKLYETYYGRYIRQLVKKYSLEKSITFLGALNEVDMCQQFLNANVFVCPSSIENSPNSLGEAMMLGVPSVSSYVGGIPSLFEHKNHGFLYQHNAPYMLAHFVKEIFRKEEIAKTFSLNSRKKALEIHDREKNLEKVMEIYMDIMNAEL